MIFPVLATKLQKPQLPDGVIQREALLDDSGWANVILVSAQAGSGKSTAVSTWLSKQKRAYCWYSLDDWDNDLMHFFTYIAAGTKSIDVNVSDALEQLLDAFQSLGFEAFLKALINELHAIKHPFIYILDDYHVIRNEQIHQVFRTMLEHFPPLMQLVLITREDPPFPLAKMRASKKLLELRISKLKFTEEEARVYFLQHLQLSLEEEQLQHLILRAEGWIAGLQMTVLSMQGLDEIEGFIDALMSSNDYIMDYLMEEVLERHPPEIKSFLLRTSMLESFTGDLCDDVLQFDAGASSAIIEKLMKTNSFIISIDSSHHWYRYHHLFRDLLRQRLDHQFKSELKKLHLRAGLWFKTIEHEQEAIHHFLLAKAFDQAAALLENKWYEMDVQLQSESWLEMVKKLPEFIIKNSPVLAMGYGWALLDMGEVEACRTWFDKAQDLYDRFRATDCQEDIFVSDMTQFNLLPATIATANAYIAAAIGDIEGIFTHAQDALMRIPFDQYYKRGVVAMLLAIAHWNRGDLNEAEAIITQSLKDMKGLVNQLVENSFSMVLGELSIQQGLFDKAKARFEQTISRVAKQDRIPIMLASLYLGLAKIAFLRNETKDAYAYLKESRAFGQRYSLVDWKYKYNLLLARVYCSEGLYGLARDCIFEGKKSYVMNPLPDEITLEVMENMIDEAENAHRKLAIIDENSLNTRTDRPLFKKEHINQSLSEPLTVRELEVLSLIASGLSNQEICDTLFLALSTVKGYNQNIFGKLRVDRRTQAVTKAKELGLI